MIELSNTVSYAALEAYGREIEALELYGDVPGMEAGIFTSIIDGFLRITRNLFLQLTSFGKSFKRSELKAYLDGHQFATSKVLQNGVPNMYNLMVPKPTGMKVTYSVATEVVMGLYTKLAIGDSVKQMLDYCKTVNAINDTYKLVEYTKHTTKAISKLSKDEVEKALRPLFNTNKTQDVKFSEVYADLKDFQQVTTSLLELDTIFKDVSTISQQVQLLNTQLSDLLDALESGGNKDRAFLKALYEFVWTAAVQLDMYGVILDRFQVLEHNHVLALAVLVKHS